ncbi:hypothetical protein CBS147345_7685 [Aspergillus niger]|nr:hypothetical protein CBS147345_7685 [Aspergillus niger]
MYMIVLVSVWTVVFGVGTIFICGGHPANAWGTIAVVTTECSLQVPIVEGYAISDFIMDVIIWLLPLPRIWLLNISVRQKMALGLVFLVGLLAIAASATRMAIYIAHLINPFAQSDGETLVTYLLFWTMIECGLGVIVICLPSLRPILSILCTGLLVDRILFPLDAKPPQPNPEYETASHGNHWIQFQWSTGIYSSSKPEDFDAVNKAWEEIFPAYGFVAVDHGWAAENHLPSSMSLPSDSSKGVYILDAYHQIHCLTIIRRTLLEIRSGKSPKLPLQHSWHCFDSLLQYIVCTELSRLEESEGVDSSENGLL